MLFRSGVGWQAIGRTPGDLIVAVPVPSEAQARSLLGRVKPVRIEHAQALLLRGALSVL